MTSGKGEEDCKCSLTVFCVWSHFFTKGKQKQEKGRRGTYTQIDMTQGKEDPNNHKIAQEKPRGSVGASPRHKMLKRFLKPTSCVKKMNFSVRKSDPSDGGHLP